MKHDELESLIDSLLDADLSEADFLRLEAEMQLRPEARQLYYEKLRLDTLLSIESDQAAKGGEPANPRRPLNWHAIGLGAAAAALLLVSAVSGWLVGNRPEKELAAEVGREPLAVGFGVVSETADAVWEDGVGPIDRSDHLPTGRLRLDSGLIKLDLFSGVNVIVEGPAEFELLSSMAMSVTRGKVRAQVPEQAHGFRIETAGGQLVDLGTEFSMDVSPAHTDLHVPRDGGTRGRCAGRRRGRRRVDHRHPRSRPGLHLPRLRRLFQRPGRRHRSGPGRRARREGGAAGAAGAGDFR